MSITQRWWLLAGLLLAVMLVPIWIGPYAPLYDYANHLLEAQVAARYTDSQLGYADGYEINPNWYLHSNALSTLLMIGLGRVMPMTLAGHLVLSLYLALFVGGLALLLRQAGALWPLLLLAPPLAYNFAFTSGWINFCYGAALGLYALAVYLRWQEQERHRDLLGLALLLLLIYTAHLMAWMLLIVVFSTMMAVETYQTRRHGALMLVMNSALPLLLVTRPILMATVFIGPIIWCGAALLRWLRLSARAMIFGTLATVGLALALTKLLEPLGHMLSPELGYSQFDKIVFPLLLLTLPHQFFPPDPVLITYNLVLLLLILVLTGLLAWSTLGQPDPNRRRWLAAAGLLGLFYVIVPSRTPDIWITEPRVLLFATFIALASVRMPVVGNHLRRAVTTCAVSLCLLSLGGTVHYAQVYDLQARAWSTQMASLAPARNVLMLREKMSIYISRPTVLGIFNRFYTGEYYSATYALEHGGFTSKLFNNGPVRPRKTIPIPAYDWPGFDDTHYVAEQCPALRNAYDAVLFWGKPDAVVAAQLDDCFTPGPRWHDMAIWRYRTEP